MYPSQTPLCLHIPSTHLSFGPHPADDTQKTLATSGAIVGIGPDGVRQVEELTLLHSPDAVVVQCVHVRRSHMCVADRQSHFQATSPSGHGPLTQPPEEIGVTQSPRSSGWEERHEHDVELNTHDVSGEGEGDVCPQATVNSKRSSANGAPSIHRENILDVCCSLSMLRKCCSWATTSLC